MRQDHILPDEMNACGRCHHVWRINGDDVRMGTANRRMGVSDRRDKSRMDRRRSRH